MKSALQRVQHPSEQGNTPTSNVNSPGKDDTPTSSPRTKASSEYLYWTPQHVAQTHSLLSSEAPTLNFRGLYHLGTLVLVVTNIRLIIENILKYGLLVEFKIGATLQAEFESLDIRDWPVTLCFAFLALLLLVCLWLEKLSSKRRLSERTAMTCQTIILLLFILAPIAVIEHRKVAPASGFFLLFCSVILFMKMVSYVLVNRDYRLAQRNKVPLIEPLHPSVVPNPIRYPDNIRISNLAYFLAAPTLIYQLNYPRTPSIRRLWVLGKLGQLVVFGLLMKVLVDQYVIPTVKNAKVPLEELAWLKLLERVLKLSIPNLYIWLLMFYCFFHLWLNILAELLRFGDRTFYKDWWNAESLDYYWRTWNIPVHSWALRYVYVPMLALGLPKLSAANVVFFFSAVFHELLLSVPTHKLRTWAFLGMMGQMPLIILTRHPKVRGTAWFGNMLFWLSFCIMGQPLLLLLYYHGYNHGLA